MEAGHHTLNTFYRKLIWSFEALWHGEEPTKDWRGMPINGVKKGTKLMGGFFMCVWALICDLDHCYKCYAMPNSTSNHPCGLCPVDAADLPWLSFSPNGFVSTWF